MRHGILLFTSDRGLAPDVVARAAEQRGFSTLYVPEHSHVPVRRGAAGTTGAAEAPDSLHGPLPDERYLRTLDPWVSLATAAAVTSTIRLATAVALPAQHDPISLAKTVASLDHLSGGRVTLGVGFGWNDEELADHHVPADRRRTAVRERLEAMRALWSQEVASYDGELVSFGPSCAWPDPVQSPLPVVVGAGGGPQTFGWVARHADGWMTTPVEQNVPGKVAQLREAWAAAGRAGDPQVHVLVASNPGVEDLLEWEDVGVTDVVWTLPDRPLHETDEYLHHLAARLALP